MHEHIRFLVGRGSMWLQRDDHLIFHGCVPVDERGEFLPMSVDGQEYRGPGVVRGAWSGWWCAWSTSRPWPTWICSGILWCGPLSPLFGKDQITTLENDLVEEKAAHVETKNPYFNLLHDVAFCDTSWRSSAPTPSAGSSSTAMCRSRSTRGKTPLKRSGKAITIDGAFSQAYGDHGYTLVLEPERTFLAKHHHFESVEAAVRDGVDIIPEIMEVRRWDAPRRVGDTEQGDEIRSRIELLQQLVTAYRNNKLRQGDVP